MKKELSKQYGSHGSMTVETAMVLPIFLIVFINIASLIDLFGLYGEMEFALYQTGKEVALNMYAYDLMGEKKEFLDENNELTEVAARDIYAKSTFLNNYSQNSIYSDLLADGKAGIMFFRSDVMNDEGIVDLAVTYRSEPYLNIFNIGRGVYLNRCRTKAWTGYVINPMSAEEQMVYIADTGHVYHTHADCSHLELVIRRISREQISSARNSEGCKYTQCEKCKDHGESSVYIAEDGEHYHSSRDCSGLKRTVKCMKLSELSGYQRCERCMERD